jgi:hypothetical protein
MAAYPKNVLDPIDGVNGELISPLKTQETLTTASHTRPATVDISIDGRITSAHEGELLIEAILRENRRNLWLEPACL